MLAYSRPNTQGIYDGLEYAITLIRHSGKTLTTRLDGYFTLARIMIRTFLKDLPYTLTQPMYREYEDKCRELARWSEHSKYQKVKPYLHQREAIHFIFALGIYYRHVVAPFSSCVNFFVRLESEFAAGLTVGGQKIGPDFRSSLQAAVENFYDLMASFGLTQSFLAQTEVQRILMTLVELEERRKNEQD